MNLWQIKQLSFIGIIYALVKRCKFSDICKSRSNTHQCQNSQKISEFNKNLKLCSAIYENIRFIKSMSRNDSVAQRILAIYLSPT